MVVMLGLILSAVVGMLLIGMDTSANTASWGPLANAHFPLYAGILLVIFALAGGVYKYLNR